jgi:hypothetical protein
VQGLGFGIYDLWTRVSGSGSRVTDLCVAWMIPLALTRAEVEIVYLVGCFGFRVSGFGFRVKGLRIRVYGLGLRV